jgi:cell division septation protein DedD
MTPTRRAMLAVGVGTVVLSFILSIAPALAKNPHDDGQGANVGTVKVHDASTGQEAAESNNEPTVCSFWVGFYTSGSAEAGTWQLLSWPPTGDKSVVASGSYDTSGDGEDVTSTMSPPAGHYRFEWYASGDSNGKNKTLWVTSDCAAGEGEVATPTPTPTPVVTPTPTPTPTPVVTPTPTPVEDPGDAATETPSESPSNPEGDVLSGNPETPPPGLPDTSMGFGSTGLLAAFGILLILGAHAGRRRSPMA